MREDREQIEPPSGEQASSSELYRILIVDDSEASRAHFVEILRALPGAEPFAVESGIDALRALRAGKVSLVLCDYAMPQLSGLQVLHSIRQLHSALELPVLMLTSNDDPEVKVKAFRAGANDYIAKNSHPEELLARVGTQLALLHSHRRLFEERLRKSEHEKFAAVGRLADGLAHELNTPAQYISSNLAFVCEGVGTMGHIIGIIRREAVGEARERLEKWLVELDYAYIASELPRALEESQMGVETVASIVTVMREFARPNTPRGPTDLNEIVRSALAVTRGQWAPLADVETDLWEPMPPVDCSGVAIKQIVLRAVMDAVRVLAPPEAAGGRGRLQLRTKLIEDASRSMVALEMTCQGQLRCDPRTGSQPAPMLGLAEVGEEAEAKARRVIVDEHAGVLEVTRLQSGTRFEFHLPLP